MKIKLITCIKISPETATWLHTGLANAQPAKV